MLVSRNIVGRYLEAMATKTRHIGTCAYCGQSVKCPRGKLAHHGYRRPGYGYIEGSCPGTHHEPYEVSPKTAELGVNQYNHEVDSLKNRLREHAKATEITLKGPRSYSKERVVQKGDDDWEHVHRAVENRIEGDLKQAERLLKHYEKLVRDWKPAKTKTVEEEEAKKRERADVVRQKRMERYTTNRDKTMSRLRKAFEKVQKAEKALKSARDGKKIAKALKAAASGAYIIYQTFYGKPYKLEQNYPGPISRDDIIADWASDDILEHMGLKTSGGYVKGSEASKMESKAFSGNYDEDMYLWDGLDHWAPFWPGWKGKIQYPEGSTGRKNPARMSW